MENGQFIGCDKHDKLFAKFELYKNFFNAQQQQTENQTGYQSKILNVTL